MGTICEVGYFGLWDCKRPATGVFEVRYDNAWSGQNDEGLDYPFCDLHEVKARKMAASFVEFMRHGSEISNVSITRVIEGKVHEVEHVRSIASLSSKEF